ncbi:MAG: phenylalanine--tRNA ligase subunit alpha [Anaerolineaceae bacterium]|nr:phenylalanine--tRNA ligase subunit alpha [Anaerolineaceae bacterium]
MLEIEEKLQAELARGVESLRAVGTLESLEAWKQEFLGKSSLVMKAFGSMGQVSKEERPLIGKAVNQVKVGLEAALAEKEEGVKAASQQEAFTRETLDVTLPGRKPRRGRIHPLHLTLRQIYKIFGDMGFQIYRSPEVETDDYNFTYLNMPPYHPARDMWDTFYTDKEGVLLRTHTSPGQVHVMRERAPENIRVILPGTTMRYEQLTARSEIEFIQVELLVVGKGITFADMRGTLNDFARRTFGENARTRLRPSYFPFTEPSAEMDVECFVCGGEGCGVCKGTGWLEILGCGMVHPTVLQYGGYDPSVYSGFAAGMGIDRSTLMRYHIDDIRHFRNNDIRFLEQF